VDVIGILPAPDEVRAFLADADPPKRAKLIDRLLARHESADYWALKWGGLLRIKSEYQSACITKLAAGAITPPHR
jgi:hypothetical protein